MTTMTVYIKLHLFLYTIFDNFKACVHALNVNYPHERHPPEFLT